MAIRKMFPDSSHFNAVMKECHPELWEKIKGKPPSKALAQTLKAFGARDDERTLLVSATKAALLAQRDSQ